MLFPTHLAAAYLVGERWDLPLLWVILGSAAPDLIDKPLAIIGFVDLYQSIGHALLLLLGITVLALISRTWTAIWAGWASHLLLDALHLVINGRPEDLRFLAWPVIEHTPAVHLPPIEFAVHYLGTPSFYLEIVIWIVFVYVMTTSDRFA